MSPCAHLCRTFAATVLAAACVGPASAHARHRHTPYHLARERHAVRQSAPAAPPRPLTPAHSYYPEDVKGGVPGNLPFNNQIRKLTDPLNANGAGH